MSLRPAALLLALGLVGCSNPPHAPPNPDQGMPTPGLGLQVVTTATTFAAGTPVVASVVNVSSDTLWLAQCCGRLSVAVDRWTGSSWERFGSGLCLANCDMVPTPLAPGHTTVGQSNTPLVAGHYRLHVGAQRRGATAMDWAATSNGFDVQ